MAKIKIRELREKSENELLVFLKEKREALRNFRFQTANSKTKNTKEAFVIRKDIAKTLTLLNELKLKEK